VLPGGSTFLRYLQIVYLTRLPFSDRILPRHHKEEILMEKFIPYEKLSKKEKRSRDLSRRNTWGQLNPVTRKPKNSKAYCRSKARNWKRDAHEPIPGLYFIRVFNKTLKSVLLGRRVAASGHCR
jgi:hypothetical protein